MVEEGQTEGQCMLKVNSIDAVNNSLTLLVGSFFFILFVIRASRVRPATSALTLSPHANLRSLLPCD